MSEGESFQQQREQMVNWQILHRGITDERLLDAFRRIPRHLFVPPEYRSIAYADHPLPIGCGQTISQPYMVAYMTNLLGLRGSERILEVGTGSGYQAAILGCLAGEVHSIELHQELAELAAHRLAVLGLTDVHIHCADGTRGWLDAAPYDGILVTAAAPRPPKALLEQLAEGGCLVLPIGGPENQVLERWTHRRNDLHREVLLDVVFVPLRGSGGWDEKEWPNRNFES